MIGSMANGTATIERRRRKKNERKNGFLQKTATTHETVQTFESSVVEQIKFIVERAARARVDERNGELVRR